MTIYRLGDAVPAVIGKQCLVGAGAIVAERKVFPDRSLILGAPAKLVRALTDEDLARLDEGADDYIRKGVLYRNDLQAVTA
jgi:carbonic anhydrase/acetyltransferase-like protein (isoleucine patch superfamily)